MNVMIRDPQSPLPFPTTQGHTKGSRWYMNKKVDLNPHSICCSLDLELPASQTVRHTLSASAVCGMPWEQPQRTKRTSIGETVLYTWVTTESWQVTGSWGNAESPRQVPSDWSLAESPPKLSEKAASHCLPDAPQGGDGSHRTQKARPRRQWALCNPTLSPTQLLGRCCLPSMHAPSPSGRDLGFHWTPPKTRPGGPHERARLWPKKAHLLGLIQMSLWGALAHPSKFLDTWGTWEPHGCLCTREAECEDTTLQAVTQPPKESPPKSQANAGTVCGDTEKRGR